ncbi:MAG: hypothetical protein QOE07_389 [Acidimicrobiaceae bacterium]|jgi:hypothetical protein|nr:hypothetical protein [Acidimicrobiaceae bacterium]MDQ1441776.1 hypothetical protein [Acidimicrobiaceae bacterium]
MGTVDRLLAEHVSFRCTSVDRVGIRGFIPGLQYEGGVVKFLVNRGQRIPSPAALNANHERLLAELDAMVASSGVPVLRFSKGECKEDVARPYQDAAAAVGHSGVVLVGKAQERTSSWRGFVDESHASHRPGHPHIAWRRMSSVPDHWYLYFADDEWGPAFLKMCTYAPYPMWCCANGHEWAKRQLAKEGVAFQALDNGLLAVDDPGAAHRICARLGAGHVRDLLGRMMAVMPDPLTVEDRRAGFDWSFSVAQLEVSDTAVFDAPRRARAWFEAAIGDHLDLGRPERVSLVVDRRVVNRGKYKTPGRFATEVITRDVIPQLQIHYKSSKAKAYLKEGRALRVETTVNNPADFAVHKTLNTANWRTLRRLGADTNTRFLAALGEGQPGLPDPATLESVVLPSVHDGQRAPGLRFGEPRTTALLASVAAFAHVIGGLTNRSLRHQMAALWNPDYTQAQASYDLRRLRLKGLIERVEHTNTYRVTAKGHSIASFLTKLATRVVIPALTDLDDVLKPPKAAPRPVRDAWRAYERSIDTLVRKRCAA